MSMTWRQRLHLNPELADIADWPSVIEDDLPAQKRRVFRRNYRIAASILNGRAISEIAAQERLSTGRITQLMNRCLGSLDEEPPELSYGLIPYTTPRVRERRQPFSQSGERHEKGNSCAFQALLKDVSGLSSGLDAMIEAKLRDSPHAQRIAPQDLHAEFKRLLGEAQWPRNRYPYTTDSLAYESVRRYGQTRIQQIRCDLHSRRTSHHKGTALPAKAANRVLERIQIDEHRLDLENRLHLELDGLRVPLRLGRASVLIAVDVFSGCCLGVHLSLTKAPDQDALLMLLAKCLSPEPMMTFTTDGLKLTPGAGFPSQMHDLGAMSLGIVEMDNAWMHRAGSVANLLCDRLGATIHQSKPCNPLGRALVESVFSYLATHTTHRFAATSGTGPQDPRRESAQNRKRAPTCSLRTLEEVVTIIMAEHNLKPQADRGGLSPLELVRLARQQQCLRYRSEIDRARWKPFQHQIKVPIHRPADRHHRAYVNFEYCRYGNAAVLDIVSDAHVMLQYDRRDIRTLEAFSLTGQYLGVLHAPPAWSRYPHGVMLRRTAMKHCSNHRKHTPDPLSAYFRELLDNRGQPGFALELLRVAREIAPGQTVDLTFDDTQEGLSPCRSVSRSTLRKRYAALIKGEVLSDHTSR